MNTTIETRYPYEISIAIDKANSYDYHYEVILPRTMTRTIRNMHIPYYIIHFPYHIKDKRFDALHAMYVFKNEEHAIMVKLMS